MQVYIDRRTKLIDYLSIDIDAVVTKGPEAGLGPLLHAPHGRLELGRWLGPSTQDIRPVGNHLMQGVVTTLVPVERVEVKVYKLQS